MTSRSPRFARSCRTTPSWFTPTAGPLRRAGRFAFPGRARGHPPRMCPQKPITTGARAFPATSGFWAGPPRARGARGGMARRARVLAPDAPPDASCYLRHNILRNKWLFDGSLGRPGRSAGPGRLGRDSPPRRSSRSRPASNASCYGRLNIFRNKWLLGGVSRRPSARGATAAPGTSARRPTPRARAGLEASCYRCRDARRNKWLLGGVFGARALGRAQIAGRERSTRRGTRLGEPPGASCDGRLNILRNKWLLAGPTPPRD